MKTRTSSLMDSHLVDFSNKNANSIKSNSTKSLQLEISNDEISDEEIKEYANEHSNGILADDMLRSFFILGAQWYRGKLKTNKKQIK
jgi:hypothetical protein